MTKPMVVKIHPHELHYFEKRKPRAKQTPLCFLWGAADTAVCAGVASDPEIMADRCYGPLGRLYAEDKRTMRTELLGELR